MPSPLKRKLKTCPKCGYQWFIKANYSKEGPLACPKEGCRARLRKDKKLKK